MGRLRSSRGGFDVPPMPLRVLPGVELRGPADWKRIFGREAPLVVELGFGKDAFLLDRAESFPQHDHVGVERDATRASTFAAAAERRGLENVRVLPIAGELALGLCFADGSIHELHVYFPDPWPKDRHAWQRMIRPWFAQEAERTLAPGGRVYLATDDLPYARQMREVLEERGLRPVETHPETPGGGRSTAGHETQFERLWRSLGRRIQYLAYAPRGEEV